MCSLFLCCVVLETYQPRLRAVEGHLVSSKSPSRDQDEEVAGRNNREHPIEGLNFSLKKQIEKKMSLWPDLCAHLDFQDESLANKGCYYFLSCLDAFWIL